MSSPFVVASLTSVTPIPVSSGGTGVSTSTGSGQVVLSNTPTLITPVLGSATASSISCSGSITANAASFTSPLNVVSGGTGVATSTGTGSLVLNTSPSLVTPTLGVASATSLTLSNALPVLSGGTGVTTKTGTGNVVLSSSPTLTGTATCDVLNGNIFTAASYIDAGSRIGTTLSFAPPNNGGTFISWNKNSDGVSHFMNQKGSGTGGFTWLAYNSSNVLYATPMTLLPGGDLTITGAFNASSATLGSALPVASGGTGVTTSTGSGSIVLNTSPTLVSPSLGAATATSLSLSAPLGVLSGGTGVTTSTGTGSTVLSASPTLTGTITVSGSILSSGFRNVANGIFTTGNPNMGSQGMGLGWNVGGNGESNFYNNNANGTVPGGWYWKPCTDSSVGSAVMSLSQGGNLYTSGTLTVSQSILSYGIRNIANGIFTTGNPDMSSQGNGIGWNYTGNGESIFYNNNANGVVSGGWNWRPCTNSSIGSPVMTLSQGGNLNVVGNITGANINFSSGTWTPVLASHSFATITQLNYEFNVGYYWINGKSITIYFSTTFSVNTGIPASTYIILKGLPAACATQNIGGQYVPATPVGRVTDINSNVYSAVNPIYYCIPPQGGNSDAAYYGAGPYYGLTNYDGKALYFNAAFPIINASNNVMSGYLTYAIP